MTILHLDAETYSATPISDGLDRYFNDPSYELLMLAWAVDDGPVRLWVPAEGEPMPSELEQHITLQDEIHAFNAAFEWYVIQKMGYPLPIQDFRCTMVRAYSLGFSGSLGEVQAQVDIPQDKRKMAEGKKLIHRFCKPAPSNHKADRYDATSHPQEWTEFKNYCMQDVVAERELELRLSVYPADLPIEHEYWCLDHKINQRGLPIDLDLVKAAIQVDKRHKVALKQQLMHYTGLENPGSRNQFLGWLQQSQPGVDNVRKETLQGLVQSVNTPEYVRQVLELKLKYSKTSNAKWAAFLKATSADDRLRNVFQFAGAQRTKRWAGRIVQPHNLPSSLYDDQGEYEAAVSSLMCRSPYTLEAIWDDVSALLSQSIRGAVTASEGCRLVVSDYSSIESRVLGWLAGCERINRLFREGLDSYKDFATELFHVSYDRVTKAQRKFAKPPVLGAGYGLGWKGLIAYAEGYGIDMSDREAQHAIDTFRGIYPEIPALWRKLQWMVEQAITSKDGSWVGVGCVQAGIVTNDMLAIQLPSGRCLYYHKPLWSEQRMPWGEIRMGFSYAGMDQYTHKWGRVKSHPGKITEQITQAVARDLLADGLLSSEQARLTPVGHVHDEIICETPEGADQGALQALTEIMSSSPDWASDLLIGAAGWAGYRYRKD